MKYQLRFTSDSSPKKGTWLVPFYAQEQPIHFAGTTLPVSVFEGKKDTSFLHMVGTEAHHIYIGLGKNPCYADIVRAYRLVSAKQHAVFADELYCHIPDDWSDAQIEAAFVGLLLGSYQIGFYKKDRKPHPLEREGQQVILVGKHSAQHSVARAEKVAAAKMESMAMVDLPPNKVNPTYLAEWAQQLAARYDSVHCTTFDRTKCQEIGLHAFLAVSRGSANEPQFIILEYRPENPYKHVGLVGKAMTFDTGGHNIKQQGMVYMKSDMAGGAAVLGAMQLTAALQLPVAVTAVVPACDNMIDNLAQVPSDVIQSYSGYSIEIIDTDAEGRVVLADGLAYLLKHYQPDYVADLATLTGSCVMTFGQVCAGMATNNAEVQHALSEIGCEINEKVWPLPLWDDYNDMLESDIADVKNFSGRPVAGAISAAKFLEFFTEKHPAWVHLDIAGASFVDDVFAKGKHASGYGVHLMARWIELLAAK